MLHKLRRIPLPQAITNPQDFLLLGEGFKLRYKDDYCAEHELFHCSALYVGKGRVKARIFEHAQKKDFGDAELVYFTYLEMPNRQAKYIEQLLLDLYHIPLNKAENPGSVSLCSYLDQAEADYCSTLWAALTEAWYS